jgi:hypothetical protein
MRRWADLIRDAKDDLAAICTVELGKPFTESLVTVKYGTDFLDWFEGAIERQYGETIPAAKGENRIFTIRQPQGVVAAITPWNSPIAMITRKVGAAIAAGNTVVCKPAPETPLCAIAVAKLFEKAGGPPGVLNIVTSSTEKSALVGEEMTQNPFVRHLSFTGSTAVGRYLHSECAKTFKKTSLELGGNAPFIVFEDANLDKAAEGMCTLHIHTPPMRRPPQPTITLPDFTITPSLTTPLRSHLLKIPLLRPNLRVRQPDPRAQLDHGRLRPHPLRQAEQDLSLRLRLGPQRELWPAVLAQGVRQDRIANG